jgi:hypothetical protein
LFYVFFFSLGSTNCDLDLAVLLERTEEMVDTLLLRSDDDGAGPFRCTSKASKPWYTVGLDCFEGGGIVESSSLELELEEEVGAFDLISPLYKYINIYVY